MEGSTYRTCVPHAPSYKEAVWFYSSGCLPRLGGIHLASSCILEHLQCSVLQFWLLFHLFCGSAFPFENGQVGRSEPLAGIFSDKAQSHTCGLAVVWGGVERMEEASDSLVCFLPLTFPRPLATGCCIPLHSHAPRPALCCPLP